MEAYKIKAGGNTISALVKSGKYDWFNDDIEKFPFEPTKAKEIEIVNFNRTISSEDAIKELDARGLRPATATELLLLGAQHPELQRKDWIVALGTVRSIRDFRSVASLSGDSAYRYLHVFWFENDWFEDFRFAAVRKLKSLDTRKLGGGKDALDPLDLDGKIIEIDGVKYKLVKNAPK